MMKTFFPITLVAISLILFAGGCEDSATTNSASTDAHSEDDEHAGHSHDHSPKHGGHLIEIGRNHEYHAELVDDHKTESITVYMMDGHMEPLTVDQSSISLVLTAGGDTETFELTASQSGGSDQFSSNDENMMEMFEDEAVKGKLRVTIDGKPFTGSFDHHGHSHDDDHDDDHDDEHDDEHDDDHDEHDDDHDEH